MLRTTAPPILREFFEADPNAVLLSDGSGAIVFANSRASELFGYPGPELERMRLDDLVPLALRADNGRRRAGYPAAPRARAMGEGRELRARRRDGTQLPVEVALSSFESDGDLLVRAVVVDITERRSAERRSSVLVEASRRLSGALRAEEVARIVVDLGPSALGASAALLAVLEEGGLVLAGVRGQPAKAVARFAQAMLLDGAPVLDAIERRATVVLSSRDAPNEDPVVAFPPGVASVACVPLLADERPLGVLALAFPDERGFEGDDRRFAEILAATCGQALDRARLFEAERRSHTLAEEARRQATTISRLNEAVAEARNADEVASLLVDDVFATFPASTVALTLLDEASGEFVLVDVRAAGRTPEARARWPFELATPARDVVLSRDILILDQAGYRARYPEVSAISDPSDIGTYLALPLIVGGRAIGALGLTLGDRRAFTEDELGYLRALGGAGAQAIERANLITSDLASRRLLEHVIAQMPVSVVVAEAPSGRVIVANRATAAVVGSENAAALSIRDWSTGRFLHGDGSPYRPSEWPLARSLATGDVVTDERVEIREAGAARWASVSSAPLRDKSGRIVAAVATASDITAGREAELARDAFIGILSHELRTPITTIFGGSKALMRPGRLTDPVAAELAQDIAAEAERLQRLVEDLLVLSRVERGADMTVGDPVLLQRLVPRIVAYEEARWPGRRFELSLPPALPPISGDDSYIEQILRNLLSNAAKYGPAEGGIGIDVALDDDEVIVRVTDEGPGFAPGDEESVFGLFYRAPSAVRTAPGAGIGLYAARALVTAIGGRIWAASREGGGAEVAFALRVLHSEPPEEDTQREGPRSRLPFLSVSGRVDGSVGAGGSAPGPAVPDPVASVSASDGSSEASSGASSTRTQPSDGSQPTTPRKARSPR